MNYRDSSVRRAMPTTQNNHVSEELYHAAYLLAVFFLCSMSPAVGHPLLGCSDLAHPLFSYS